MDINFISNAKIKDLFLTFFEKKGFVSELQELCDVYQCKANENNALHQERIIPFYYSIKINYSDICENQGEKHLIIICCLLI